MTFLKNLKNYMYFKYKWYGTATERYKSNLIPILTKYEKVSQYLDDEIKNSFQDSTLNLKCNFHYNMSTSVIPFDLFQLLP